MNSSPVATCISSIDIYIYRERDLVYLSLYFKQKVVEKSQNGLETEIKLWRVLCVRQWGCVSIKADMLIHVLTFSNACNHMISSLISLIFCLESRCGACGDVICVHDGLQSAIDWQPIHPIEIFLQESSEEEKKSGEKTEVKVPQFIFRCG